MIREVSLGSLARSSSHLLSRANSIQLYRVTRFPPVNRYLGLERTVASSSPGMSLPELLVSTSPEPTSCVALSSSAGCPSGAPETFSLYKRKLPSTAIPFSSPEGKKIFREALLCGTMEVGVFGVSDVFVSGVVYLYHCSSV